jgi:DNA-binding CsgD family transcriptional regulator
MNQAVHCVDLERLCDVKGFLHAYFIDVDDRLRACNKLALDFFRDLYGQVDIIGQKMSDLLEAHELGFTKSYFLENQEILESGIPKQYYHTWIIKGLYRLDLLTFRMPIFDANGKVLGILTISHFINKFSIEKAYQCGLSNREVECLFYLLEGCTAKETAINLQLSPRTVEGYIESMKNKLGCSTASELLIKVMHCEIRENYQNHFNVKVPLLNNSLPAADILAHRNLFYSVPA